MANYTVAYQPQIDGFTSFFSFDPEWMIGMNNNLYSFKNGQIWKHYINPLRGNYYGVQNTSYINMCFNDSPSDVKLFKTFSYDGIYPEGVIDATFATQLSDRIYAGVAYADYFEVKEGQAFSYIRSSDASEFNTTMKEQGVGALYSHVPLSLKFTIKSPSFISPPVVDPASSGYGDSLFFINSSGEHNEIGIITAYYYSNGNHVFYVEGVLNDPEIGDLMVISKNVTSESYGLRGPYMSAQIVITSTEKVELFSVSTDIFKSFP